MNCCVRRKRFHRDCVLPTPTGCRFSHILRQFLSFTLVEHSAVRTRVGRCLIYPDGPANMVTDSGFNVFRFPTLTATSLGAPFFNDKVGQTTITSAMQRIVAQYVRFAPGHTVAYAAASFAANTGTATLTSQYPIASTVPFLMATNGVCWVDNPQNVPIGASNFAIVGFANATAVRLVRSAVTGRVECPVALVQLTRPAPGPTTRPPTPAPTTRAPTPAPTPSPTPSPTPQLIPQPSPLLTPKPTPLPSPQPTPLPVGATFAPTPVPTPAPPTPAPTPLPTSVPTPKTTTTTTTTTMTTSRL
jgi:hypothetical protein